MYDENQRKISLKALRTFIPINISLIISQTLMEVKLSKKNYNTDLLYFLSYIFHDLLAKVNRMTTFFRNYSCEKIGNDLVRKRQDLKFCLKKSNKCHRKLKQYVRLNILRRYYC